MRALAYLIGAGSMSIGVEAAGFELTEVWETPGYSKNAQTWDLNRPELAHHVIELNWESNHFHRYREPQLDLIFGNPPCGGLSAMTCSRIESPTNNCMRQWMRMVTKAQPRLILMENAYQLATARASSLLDDLTEVLDKAGYWWWTWMFYSYQVGTPQIRRRMFLCASLDPPKRHDLLKLNDLPDEGKATCPAGPWLEDLVGVEPAPGPVTTRWGRQVTQHWYHPAEEMVRRNALLREHHVLASGRYITPDDFEAMVVKAEAGDEHALRDVEKWQDKVWYDVPKEFKGMCMHRPQLIKWDVAAPATIGFFKFIHPHDHRFLTMREMARLMGYPDYWEFHRLLPSLIAQGIPVNNAFWAADRMLRVVGWRE